MPHFEGMKCAQPIQVVLNIGLHGQTRVPQLADGLGTETVA